MIIRRKFIQGIACGLGMVEAGAAVPTRTVKYSIEGFTCITCAVGLDALLADRKGIVKSKSSYPDRTSVIEYNPQLVTETEIKGYIQELGFRARGGTI
jgi:copper chaperone CopZ